MWTAKSALTFSISERILSQHIAFTTFSSILLLSWQCKGSEMNFCQSLDHGRTTTKRESNKIDTDRSMSPLTCEFWQDSCSVTFSDLWFHYCKGSKKNSGHSLYPSVCFFFLVLQSLSGSLFLTSAEVFTLSWFS
jgi:hypothetical protein